MGKGSDKRHHISIFTMVLIGLIGAGLFLGFFFSYTDKEINGKSKENKNFYKNPLIKKQHNKREFSSNKLHYLVPKNKPKEIQLQQ